MVVKKGPIKFEELFAGRVLLDDLVTTFFAVLELSKHQAVLVEQDELFGELTLSQGPQSEEYEREQFTTN